MRNVAMLGLMMVVACGMLHVMGPNACADPAIVVRDAGPCGMAGADANGNMIFGGLGEATHVVENGNNVTLTCKGRNITNLSGKAQHFSGFPCGIFLLSDGSFVVTTDSHATVAKNGNATLTCTFTKP